MILGRTKVCCTLLLAVGLVVGSLPSARAALPTQFAPTLMVNDTVRAIEQVGSVLWIGGRFTQVKTKSGTVVANVTGLAAFNASTGAYLDIAPDLNGTTPEVRDFDAYGGNLVVAGKFTNGSSQKNLVMINGTTGSIVKWFNSPVNWTVLAASDLGRIYAAGVSMAAYAVTGPKLWTKGNTTYVSPPGHNYPASHRDLLRDGSVIWSACICDTVSGASAKSIVKFDLEGNRLAYPVTETTLDKNATGYAVVTDGNALYLGAGGSDAIWKLSKGGAKIWRRDTSGSTQTLAIMDGKLVAGGHFLRVADNVGDTCGFRSSNPATLDPNGECAVRLGLAAYSFDGALDPDFKPSLSGKYNLAWALFPQGSTLHVGGQYTKVNGVLQSYYTRFGTLDDSASKVLGPPVIESFDPKKGTVGTRVRIHGARFRHVLEVRLAGNAVGHKVVSPTLIRFKLPRGAQSGKIAVTSSGGTDKSEKRLRVR